MPGEYPHLSRAPIREAVLDLLVEIPADKGLSEAEEFAGRVGADFPHVQPVRSFQAKFSVGQGAPSPVAEEVELGRICWNEQRSRAVQARTNGFTLNHVGMYQDWAALQAQARPLWALYVELFRPSKVVRCGLRYINRLNFADGDAISRLRTRPLMGGKLPSELKQFFMRVELPFEDDRGAVVTESSIPPEPGGVYRGAILDIEVFLAKQIDPVDPRLWEELKELRRIKNQCFFESLDERAWEEFK